MHGASVSRSVNSPTHPPKPIHPFERCDATPTHSSRGQSALLPTSVTTRLGLHALARACSIHVATLSKDFRLGRVLVFDVSRV